MSCFFLYSASRRANLSAQAAHTVYYLFELKSPHVNGTEKFNRFRNRTDASGFVSAGIGGVLDHVEIEEISGLKVEQVQTWFARNDTRRRPLQPRSGRFPPFAIPMAAFFTTAAKINPSLPFPGPTCSPPSRQRAAMASCRGSSCLIKNRT